MNYRVWVRGSRVPLLFRPASTLGTLACGSSSAPVAHIERACALNPRPAIRNPHPGL